MLGLKQNLLKGHVKSPWKILGFFKKMMFYQFILSFKKFNFSGIFWKFWDIFENFENSLNFSGIFNFFLHFFHWKTQENSKILKKDSREEYQPLVFQNGCLNGLQPPKSECAKRMNQTSCPEEDRRVLPGLPSEGKNDSVMCTLRCCSFGELSALITFLGADFQVILVTDK